MRTSSETRPAGELSEANLYRVARRAGMHEWHSRQFAVIATQVELNRLRRLVELGCPRELLAAIVL